MASGVKHATVRAVKETQVDTRQPLPLHAGARLTARVTLALALVVAALWIAADFLPALIWAAILAVTIWPLYQTFAARFSPEQSALPAFAFTRLVALIVFTPLALVIYQVAKQSDVLSSWIAQSRDNGIKVPEWIARLPIAADAVQQWWRDNLTDPKSATAWLQSMNADKPPTSSRRSADSSSIGCSCSSWR